MFFFASQKFVLSNLAFQLYFCICLNLRLLRLSSSCYPFFIVIRSNMVYIIRTILLAVTRHSKSYKRLQYAIDMIYFKYELSNAIPSILPSFLCILAKCKSFNYRISYLSKNFCIRSNPIQRDHGRPVAIMTFYPPCLYFSTNKQHH